MGISKARWCASPFISVRFLTTGIDSGIRIHE